MELTTTVKSGTTAPAAPDRAAPARTPSVGQPVTRLDGPAKVTGTAPYAYEHPVSEPLFLYPVRATVTRGRVTSIDTAEALALHDSVRVLTPDNAPAQPAEAEPDLRVLQDDEVRYRGQFVAAALADTPEIARHAARLVRVGYEVAPHDTRMRTDHPELYRSDTAYLGADPDSEEGDVEAALGAAHARIDHVYETPVNHHVPLEPPAATAVWSGADGADRVTLYDSNQGVTWVRTTLSAALGIDPEHLEIISPFVGGGFGSKVMARPHHVLVCLAARTVPERPVKIALTRRQTFVDTTFRPVTIQRVRLGAERDGTLTAIGHDAVEQTARHAEYAERSAMSTRMFYAARNRSTSHRLVPLDLSKPGFMRGPGEAPGAFALESAMDELAAELAMDPIALRLRNEPETDPESGLPFSSRDVRRCLEEGARRFDWDRRDHRPRRRLEDGWWTGTGVALASFPRVSMPGSSAVVEALPGGRYRIGIAAADIGTGALTILTQIAADALEVELPDVELSIGTTAVPAAMPAGGSGGTTHWSETIFIAVRAFRAEHGAKPPVGATATGTHEPPTEEARYSMHVFGAQFAEVRVHADTGEIRVPRLFGIFDAGRIVNPRTARSQLIGGMTMGLSMALHEESVVDHRFGHVITSDLATYHIAAHADVQDVEAIWLGTPDPHYNTLGAKGIGEVGTVGVAAAIANAAWHATGVRVRKLPLTADKFLD